LFACANPLSRGVILADEVGLGKTIEAGLVISQRWAERRRRILIIVPANLRKQWHQELQDKFNLQGVLLEAKSYNSLRKQDRRNPFQGATGPVICSYQFAKAKADDIKAVEWDLVVLDEAHRLRNVYKTSNVIAKTLKEALAHVHSKVLLTATPLQNSLLELYGLVSMIDDRVFGDIDSFRSQFTAQPREQAFAVLRSRLATVCKRTLRRQVQQYVPYTARRAMVEEFTPRLKSANSQTWWPTTFAGPTSKPCRGPAAADLARTVEAAGVVHTRNCWRPGNHGQAPGRRARSIARCPRSG
jgi:N12 class adenine-specific DNA methylase